MAISGPRARDALAKGVAVDLHPRAFEAGHAAATLVAHIGVTLWQVDEAPTFHVCVPRAFSSSFWHWLLASAAEYGFEVGA
jgi:sarcosine oxidase subunit gamma